MLFSQNSTPANATMEEQMCALCACSIIASYMDNFSKIRIRFTNFLNPLQQKIYFYIRASISAVVGISTRQNPGGVFGGE